jgi:hypothetical protein
MQSTATGRLALSRQISQLLPAWSLLQGNLQETAAAAAAAVLQQ